MISKITQMFFLKKFLTNTFQRIKVSWMIQKIEIFFIKHSLNKDKNKIAAKFQLGLLYLQSNSLLSMKITKIWLNRFVIDGWVVGNIPFPVVFPILMKVGISFRKRWKLTTILHQILLSVPLLSKPWLLIWTNKKKRTKEDHHKEIWLTVEDCIWVTMNS